MRHLLVVRAVLTALVPMVTCVIVATTIMPARAHVDPELHADHLGERLEQKHVGETGERAEQLHLRRGILHAKSQRWSEAIADFDRALEHAPTLHLARLRKADALLDGGCHQQAKHEAEAFLEHHPDHPQALITWARAVAELGAPDRAVIALDAALPQLEQPAPAIFLERARLVLRADADAFDHALAGLDEGTGRVGAVSTLVLEAVALERKAGRARQALERLQVLREHSGTQPRWVLLEGELLEELDRPLEARATYRRSLAWIAGLPDSRRATEAMQRFRLSLSQRLQRLERHSQISPRSEGQ